METPVEVRIGGTLVARSQHARIVAETGLPPVAYLPAVDLLAAAGPGSGQVTVCPYKGEASYWTVAGETDVAWSYELPLAEVLYFKAEQKYVTVRTATRSYIMDGALSELETKFAPRFLRIHRNALVARGALRALEKHYDADEGEGWAVRLRGSTELLAVSRRQVAAVREELAR